MRTPQRLAGLVTTLASVLARRFTVALGGAERTRVIVVLACVLGLSGADIATVGASATELRHALNISNTDIGLLVAVTSLVGAVATLPFGVLADHVRRTWTLGGVIVLWATAMAWSAAVSSFDELLLARLALGAVTAAASPLIASLVGDYFGGGERGHVYGLILTGELVGVGFGFAISGDIAVLSWRAAFVVLAVPALALSWLVLHLPEPPRGGTAPLAKSPAAGHGDEAPRTTDAHQLARERGLTPDPSLALSDSPSSMRLPAAVRYVLRIRTNLALIAASACGYYFLAGVETFGAEFAKQQFSIGQAFANLLLLLLGVGAIAGTLTGGRIGDWFLRRGHLSGRVVVAAAAATLSTGLFVPAILTRSLTTAIPYLMAAALALAAQNPPLDAARLDIMPPLLWGRAEAVRSLLRSLAQAAAPLLFGAVSDYVFGGGRSGLQWTFIAMLVPLAGSAALLFKASRTYPTDVATAAAAQGPRAR